MRRRTVLATGVAIGLSSIAGCLGDDGESMEPGEEPGEEPTTEPGEEPPASEVAFSIEHSGTEMDWGDEYSVTVTVRAGDEPTRVGTAIAYQTEDDPTWSGTFSNTEQVWQLDAGESRTETFEIKPPAVGELQVGLFNSMEEAVEEQWDLTVYPPVQSFGEPLSYYDGLDMTLDVELHEWLELELYWGRDPRETGIYEVRPADGQWVKVFLTGENTNMNEEVRMPRDVREGEDFSGLANNSQLDHPRIRGTNVGAGTDYVVADPTRHEEGARMEMRWDTTVQEGFWDPPSDLVSGATEEGWIVFETDMDTTVDDVEIRLRRNDIRATWK